MRPAGSHLTPQEVDLLLFGSADPRDSDTDDASAREAQQHFSECAVCQSVAEKYRKADEMLRALEWKNKGSRSQSGSREQRSPDCPADDDVWLSWTAGLLTDEEAAGYVAHAAACNRCAPLLREAMEDMAQDATAEEREALAKLPSASPGWQRAMAQKMAASGSAVVPLVEVETPARNKEPKSKEKAGFPWWPMAWAGSGLAVVLVAVLVGVRLTREPDVNQLLARVFTEQRTSELRMPGAAYGPLRVELGNGRRDLPPSFYTAQGIIKTELAKHPEDPSWLQAQGRAHLLEGDYEKAIKDLDSALIVRPNDPGLLLDKATALFQRAEQLGPEARIDYGEAAEDLGEVLKKIPNDPVALFNRAIVYEKMQAYDQAIEDLNRYLNIDPAGSWSDEARDRLRRLKDLVKKHEDALALPLADPATFVRLASDQTGLVQIEERIEDYQDLAILKWLPEAFATTSQLKSANQEYGALKALGKILATRHRDEWLNDLLAEPANSATLASALGLLRTAVMESAAGDAVGAEAESVKAAELFAAAGNRPGMARAEAERVHALRDRQEGDSCLAEAKFLAKKIESKRYQWIRTRLDIDRCSCSLMVGDFDSSQTYARLALRNADRHAYPVLRLRGIGINAAVATDEGDLVSAWAQDQLGLSAYWDNRFSPPRRAQQFYDDLSYPAENTNQIALAESLAQESVHMISLAGDRKLEALTRRHLAELAIRNGDLTLAAQELAKSRDLLTALTHSDELRSDRVYADILLAEIELLQDDLAGAGERLDSLRSQVSDVTSFTVRRAFYKTHAELLARQGRISEAEESYRQAVAIADASLAQVTSSAARMHWMQENSGLYRSLAELELKKDDPRAALTVWEWYRSALAGGSSQSADSLKSFLESGSLGKLISNLRDQTVISYALLTDGVEIWVLDNRGLQSRFVALNPTQLTNLATHFSEMCADPASNLASLRASGQNLYQALLAPVEGLLDPGRVIVVEPDEAIGDLPFQALVAHDGRYLGELRLVVLSFGMVIEQHLRPAGTLSRGARAVVVGSTVNFVGSHTVFDQMIHAADKATEVARLFPHATLLTGQTATVEDMEPQLAGAELFHYVGHAMSSVRQEGLIMLPRRGAVNAEVWAAKSLSSGSLGRLNLAVLSACSTGKNFRGRRETHGELVRALLLAGVPSIVGSRWDVDAYETGRLMDAFYTALISGETVSSSMQAAESALRSQQETRHPYYWAAFGVFGRA
jgi:CHAT domain-containing protein/tetratricopeptide (TPR) repeat protein